MTPIDDEAARVSAATIRNPVLPGFHPDPSILRVGADYYIVTSTFEWFPGVTVHHSRDLATWTSLGGALHDPKQHDLRGIPNSGGIWAPDLTYADGRFWLVYTVVRSTSGHYKDLANYLVTGPSPTGPWSTPVDLGSRGFDPAMFHDADGSHWVIGMRWDPRPGVSPFQGIDMQRLDDDTLHPVGPVTTIFQDTILVEGPHLYQHDGWYYLLLAQGGTGWEHGVSAARSRTLLGPYEKDPHHSILTSRDDPTLPLQKAGHGDLVETPDGQWYLVHLASRPTTEGGARHCITGRETGIQRVTWECGWLRLADDDGVAVPGTAGRDTVAGLSAVPTPASPANRFRDDFDEPALDFRHLAVLRGGDLDWLDLTTRPGWLRLEARDSPGSLFTQAMVAARVTSDRCVATTRTDTRPTTTAQSAGLVAWYDTGTYAIARVTLGDDGRRRVEVVSSDLTVETAVAGAVVDVHDWDDVHLRAELDGACLRFAASPDGSAWTSLGSDLDATVLSDDYGPALRFTGAFVGLRSDDFAGTPFVADFDHLELVAAPHTRDQ